MRVIRVEALGLLAAAPAAAVEGGPTLRVRASSRCRTEILVSRARMV